MAQKAALIRATGVIVLFCISLAWLGYSPRVSAALLFAALVLALLSYRLYRKRSVVVVIWALFFVATLLPIDIGIAEKREHALRVVPIVYGYPTDEAFAMYLNDQVSLGGCIIIPGAPRWKLLL